VAQVVQQRGGDEFVVGAFGLGQRGGLQRVLELRHRLAAVLLMAAALEQGCQRTGRFEDGVGDRADVRVDALEVADQVQVQRAGLDALRRVVLQPRDVVAAYSCSRSRKRAFSSSSFCASRTWPFRNTLMPRRRLPPALVQVADLGHAGLGEAAALADLLVLDVDQHALDDVADLLHVDGEADDVGPAPALALGQRLARDLVR
jgi:hypothetical protein